MKERHLGFTIKMMNNLLMRNVAMAHKGMMQKALVPMQGMIMTYLFFRDGEKVYQKDIEGEFSLPKSTVATLLKQMENKGLIRREPASHDSRLKEIVLTRENIEYQKNIMDKMEQVDKQMCEGITEEEMDTFFCVAEKIRRNCEQISLDIESE